VSSQPDADFVVDYMSGVVDYMSGKDRRFMVGAAVGMTTVVFRAVRPGHALVVSADGFTVNDYALDLGFVSWDEVGSIETTNRGPFLWIIVKLRDREAFLRRHRPLRRALLRLRGKSALATVRISGVKLPLPVSEVAQLMEARWHGQGG